MVREVHLYPAPSTVADATEIAAWLRRRIDAKVTVRDRFLETYGDEDLAETFASARVISPYERETGNTMLGILRYEERALADPDRAGGVIYDGFELQSAFEARVSANEMGLDHPHVVILDRVIGTWGDDGRWHKRVNILGPVSIVSVPGLYEAPAKPEAYYKEKGKHAMLSGDAPPREVLETEVEGDFLVGDDPRTTEALKGYVLQPIHYLRTGEAFCDESGCRLYNAHRQAELIGAQLHGSEFCDEHAEVYGNADAPT
ncbi:MAG: DUF6775 family putative metallopeptidase [Halodesulfurarchaeum sp.]